MPITEEREGGSLKKETHKTNLKEEKQDEEDGVWFDGHLSGDRVSGNSAGQEAF